MEERSWQPGMIFEAWDVIHRALEGAITPLPPQTLAFLAERASDQIIRNKAAQALDSIEGAHKSAEDLRGQFRQPESA